MRPTQAPFRLVDGRESASRAMRLRVAARMRAARVVDAAMAAAGASAIVLVSGFWRSGTTWLQESLAEALGAKTVFEPLSPLGPARIAAGARRFPHDEDAAQAFIPPVLGEDADIWPLLDRAMAGRAEDAFALSCRWSVRESLRRAVVVKDVRLQCNLALVHRRYGVPVIHVRRHPCAVVASLVGAGWHWSFARVRLADLIAGASLDGLPGADPRGFDTDEPSRIAACWAWSEARAAADLQSRPWGHLVTYEEMAGDPRTVVTQLCAALGRRPLATAAVDRPSATIHPEAFAARGTDRDRWRRSLPPATIARVEDVADAVYPDWRRLWSEEPRLVAPLLR